MRKYIMGGRYQRDLSVQLDMKARRVGSDDLYKAADRFVGDSRYKELGVQIGNGLRTAVGFALEGRHEAAGKVASSVKYLLKGHKYFGSFTMECRDGEVRPIIDVVSWFGNLHLKVAGDISDALRREKNFSEVRRKELILVQLTEYICSKAA
ncbi:MAG: hypothetical protein WC942_07280 [Clostridia bacterium]|jgi:hypothetical protein